MENRIDGIETRMGGMEQRMGGIEKRMDTMQKDIATIKDDLAELKEAHEITRDGVNTLLDWADNVAIEVKIPLKPAQ